MCQEHSQRLFKYLNRFILFFGIVSLIYHIILIFVSPLSVFMICITLLFNILLILSSGFSHTMLKSTTGTNLYLVSQTFLLISVVFLQTVALFDGYLMNAFHAIVFASELLLSIAIYIVVLIAFKHRDQLLFGLRHEVLN